MKERKHSIDVLRLVCACMVILLHTDGPQHAALVPITRCAVPCFFMISGYLLFSDVKDGTNRLIKNIRRIFTVLIWSTLIFTLYKEFLAILGTGMLFIPSVKDWMIFLLFNENPMGEHLWYLGAYLYVLFAMTLVGKYNLWKWMFPLVMFLLVINFVFGCYSVVLFGRGFYHVYLRNWLFVGIPCFTIGALIKQKESICKHVNKHFIEGGIVLFSLSSIGVTTFLHSIDKMPIIEFYPSSILLAVCLLLLAIRSDVQECRIAKIGRRDSLYIYIFHPIVIWACSPIFHIFGKCRDSVAPILVVVMTMAFLYLLRLVRIVR